jgi:formiminoglutamase
MVSPYCLLTPRQIAEDGDEGAREIYDFPGSVEAFVTTEVARAILDMNRAEDDRRADGVVKTRTCLGVAVYDPFPPEELIASLLKNHYRPYHQKLRTLAQGGVFCGIDCHTMLAIGPEIGPLAGQQRPKVCLSNVNGASCPDRLLKLLADCLQETLECDIALNDPFRGGFITRSHAGELPWIQLELSRAPFLDEQEKRSRVLAALGSFCEKAP